MSATGRSTAVGVFENGGQAQVAVDELRRAGFGEDQIGFVARDMDRDAAAADAEAGEGAATGAVTGGLIGGLLGAAAALLIPGIGPVVAGGILASALGGAAIGATAGGLLGALAGLGVPDEEARYYESEFQTGRTVVTVQAGGRYEDAVAILRQNGGYDYRQRTPMQTGSGAGSSYSSSVGAGSDATVGAAGSGMTGRDTTTSASSAGTGMYSGGLAWEDVSTSYQSDFEQNYGRSGRRWEEAEPGYRYGHELATSPTYRGREFGDIEGNLRSDYSRWAQGRGYRFDDNDDAWQRLREDIRSAWNRVRGPYTGQSSMDAESTRPL